MGSAYLKRLCWRLDLEYAFEGKDSLAPFQRDLKRLKHVQFDYIFLLIVFHLQQ